MVQDQWTLQEKEAVKSHPAHGPPLQARVVAANRTVLANFRDDPGAHGNEQGAGKIRTERGLVNVGSRHGMAKVDRQTKPAEQGHCRQTQPADEVGRPLTMQCRLVEGVRWCWPLGRWARTYLPVSLPPIAFACLCPYALP